MSYYVRREKILNNVTVSIHRIFYQNLLINKNVRNHGIILLFQDVEELTFSIKVVRNNGASMTDKGKSRWKNNTFPLIFE